jgi:LPXTG-motif cell wall-anchored protein
VTDLLRARVVLILGVLACAWSFAATAAASSVGPRVTIDGVSATSGSAELVWHADENGAYRVWLGGTYCGGGAGVASGSYEAAAQVKTSVNLRDGRSWIRVCVTDSSEHTGSDAISVRRVSAAEPRTGDQANFLIGLVAVLMIGIGLLVLRGLRRDPERAQLRETTSKRWRTGKLSGSESGPGTDRTAAKTNLDLLQPAKTNQLRLLRYARPHSRGLTVLLTTMGLSVALGLLTPWPMKLVVDNVLGDDPLPDWVVGTLAVLPGPDDRRGLLLWVALAGVAIFVAGTLIGMVNSLVSVRVGQRMAYDLGADLFLHLQRLSVIFHSRRPVGDTIARVTGDPYCVHVMIIGALLPLLQSAVTLVAMFAIMWQLEPSLTLLSLGVVPFLLAAIKIYGRPMKDTTRVTRDLEGRMMSVVQLTLNAIPAVQAFTREELEHERFRGYARETVSAYVRATVAGIWFKLFVGLATALGTAGILYLGALRVLDGEMTIGTLLVFIAYLGALYGPLNSLAYTASTWQSAAAKGDRVLEVLDAVPEVRDAPHARPLAVDGHVQYENVTFGYDVGRPALKNVSFEAHPGDVLAIVGPTGAGKTTLINLLMRFFDPWSGRVVLDGHDIRDLRIRSLREQVAMVLQDPFIFPLTIEENIGYGRPDATHEEILAAAKAANAHEFIARLPHGYGALVGERGATLSGGEKQRLSIARAFLKDAPILILDEPTSALDARTEGMLLDALERLMRGRLTFIIAHRLSTIRRADTILVVNHGKIVERGSHLELMARDGLYASLYRQQMQFAGHDLVPIGLVESKEG